MAEIVTGAPAVVGFTNGYHNNGWSHKDTIRFEAEHLRDAVHDTQVAVEKIGAANSLATEKIGAAAELTAEKIGAANALAIQNSMHATAMQMLDFKTTMLTTLKDCCCDIKKEVAEVKATVLEVDAQRVRDDLAATRAELLALRTQNGRGNGRS
jgi:phenylacetate-coenzyme A ligase PaaK-like adenylate-forming protein